MSDARRARRRWSVLLPLALPALVLSAPADRGAPAAEDFSTSIMRPSAVPPNGVIAGTFPASETRWYFALDAVPGDLMTQLSFAGREGAPKEVELEVLDGSARTRAQYWIHGEDATLQSTRGFPIDASGRQIVRLRVKGPAGGRFCLELGGKAFPTTGPAGCPAPPADVVVTPPTVTRVATVPVAATRCEQRLLLGADLFFDFDQATIRGDAEPKLAEIAGRVQQGANPVVVEGHTDAKGADDYNQQLSEARATAVKTYLVGHGTAPDRVTTVGWGERKPVAPNAQPDGSDDPDGRQRNRRVEIVVNTCT
jgi:outer membrane protein OmpA-like peptidoglycan-associated protein